MGSPPSRGIPKIVHDGFLSGGAAVMMAGGRRAWAHFVRVSRPYFTQGPRRQAYGLVAALLVILLSLSGLNVVNSYVGRDFMTAIEKHEPNRFFVLAFVYLGVFAVATIVGAL